MASTSAEMPSAPLLPSTNQAANRDLRRHGPASSGNELPSARHNNNHPEFASPRKHDGFVPSDGNQVAPNWTLSANPGVTDAPPRPPAINHRNGPMFWDQNADKPALRVGPQNGDVVKPAMSETPLKVPAILDTSSTNGPPDPNEDDDAPSGPGSAHDEVTERNRAQYPPLTPAVSRVDLLRRKPQEKIVHEVSKLESGRKRGSSDASGDEGSLAALWTRLHDQRQRTKSLRQSLTVQRKEIQAMRRQKERADHDLMTQVRPFLVESQQQARRPAPQNLSGPFDRMQAIWSDYNVAETKYEQLDLQLQREENLQEVKEAEFFSVLYGGDDLPQPASSTASDEETEDEEEEDDDDDVSDAASRITLLGIYGDRPSDIHPLYSELLDAIGERGLASEHHVDLIMRREEILYDLQMKLAITRRHEAEGEAAWDSTLSPREIEWLKGAVTLPDVDSLRFHFGSAIDEDDIEFLTQYDSEERAAREQLGKAKEVVLVLRQECLDKGAMRRNMPEHEEYAIFAATDDTKFDSMTLSPEYMRGSGGLEDSRFPILLTNPKHVLKPLTAKDAVKEATKLPRDDPSRVQRLADALKEYSINKLLSDFVPSNKADFINRWLLQRLRMSPMEADVLYSVFTAVLKVVNSRRWQEDVLYFWPRDDANKSLEGFRGPDTTRDALQGEDPQAPAAGSSSSKRQVDPPPPAEARALALAPGE